MPVAQTRGHAGKALLIAGVSVALLLVLAFVVAQAASRGDVQINLGDDRFEAGRTDRLASSIAEGDGLPLLFQDLVDRDRNIFLNHLGGDPKTGWVAFGAFDPANSDCGVEIDREAKTLVNACDRSVTYPLGGKGLRFYPTTVEDGQVIIDINEVSTTTSR